jgi:hypothetical protein
MTVLYSFSRHDDVFHVEHYELDRQEQVARCLMV